MAAKRKTVTKTEIANLNAARELYAGKVLSRKELMQILKEAGIKSISSILLKFIIDGVNPPVVKKGENEYVFSSTPIHLLRLQKVYDQIRENKKLVQKPKRSIKGSTVTEEDCIAFLKELGYRILKPVTQYEEL